MPAEAFQPVIRSYLQASHNFIVSSLSHVDPASNSTLIPGSASRFKIPKSLLCASFAIEPLRQVFTLISNLDFLTDSQQLESGDSLLVRMLDFLSG